MLKKISIHTGKYFLKYKYTRAHIHTYIMYIVNDHKTTNIGARFKAIFFFFFYYYSNDSFNR